jgi:hypothetical protein
MPTGYTADVVDGNVTDFPTFALRCARAFGALIELRDERLDAPIPDEFKPSMYHADALERARGELEALRLLTEDERRIAADAEYEAELQRRRESEARTVVVRERLNAMLAEVEAWEPPTLEHFELKRFMQQQLTETLKWDGRGLYHDVPLERQTPHEWYEAQRIKLERDIVYHTEHHAKELERVRDRNAWVKALRDSLNTAVGA